MAISAYELWNKIEKESSINLITTTGGLDLGSKDDVTIKKIITTLQETRQKYRILSVNQMKKNFPQFTLPENFISVFQKDAGVINAKKQTKYFRS